MLSILAELRETSNERRTGEFQMAWLAPVIFSLIYFVDVSLRASEKYFWYDELFTLYFSQLPTFHALWTALTSGIDFNPPPFYWITHLMYSLFGESNLGLRAPEIIGFWVFCLSLYRFVYKTGGLLAATIAMLLPVLTGAYYYAYEARPHALVLGFCGLSLVFWQTATQNGPAKIAARFALGLSMFGALMMHCFAITLLVPLAITEIVRTFRTKTLDRGMWFALVTPAVLAEILYVPLFRSYKKLATGTTFANFSHAGWTQIEHYFDFLLKDSLLIIVLIVVLLALGSYLAQTNAGRRNDFAPSLLSLEMVAGLALLALPAFGVALGKVLHGPFFSRYFLSAAGGLAICIGLGAGRAARRWIAGGITAALAMAILYNSFLLFVDRGRGRGEWLIEPSSKLLLDTKPGKPLYLHPLLASGDKSLPIAVLNPLEFIYLVHYDPALNGRLYYLAPSTSDFTYLGFSRLLECCLVKFNSPVVYSRFVAEHAEFLAYGDPDNFSQIAQLEDFHSRMESMKVEGDHFLAHLKRE